MISSYALSFVGYIDAVKRVYFDDFIPALPETQTPIGMVAGVNYWEPYGSWLVHGTQVNGMGNIEYTQTDDGARITHIDIQYKPSLWDDIVHRVKSNMPQK